MPHATVTTTKAVSCWSSTEILMQRTPAGRIMRMPTPRMWSARTTIICWFRLNLGKMKRRRSAPWTSVHPARAMKNRSTRKSPLPPPRTETFRNGNAPSTPLLRTGSRSQTVTGWRRSTRARVSSGSRNCRGNSFLTIRSVSTDRTVMR